MALDGGGVEYGLRDLSSAAPGCMDCSDLDVNMLQELTSQTENKRVISGLALRNRPGIRSEGELVNGLITGHAYSILKFARVGNEMLVNIRNPW